MFMSQTHYKLWYRIYGADQFILWYSNEHDGVVINSEGCIPSFRTESALLAYADALSIAVQSEEPLLHDLDLVQLWLANPHPKAIDPQAFLSAWNLFGDVARTLPAVGARFTESYYLLGPLYDKLFWANNLPSMTPEGEIFVPEWSTIEIEDFKALLREGLDMFVRSLREAG